MMPDAGFALRFLSGRFEGAVVPLEPGRPTVIGRQPGNDLVVADDLVSRQHARLSFEGDVLYVEDLDSTNGTYLNGVRIKRASANVGDRVLLGGSILKIVPRQGAVPPVVGLDSSDELAADTRNLRRGTAIQGLIEEVPLPDVLQLLATARKTGILAVQGEGHAAEVWLDRGRVTECILDGREDLAPHKSLYRVLGWSNGRFELRSEGEEGNTRPIPQKKPVPQPVEVLIMEGMRQLDELKRLRSNLPDRLVPTGKADPDLDEMDRSLIALSAEGQTVQGILDATELADVEAAERLLALVRHGFLMAKPT